MGGTLVALVLCAAMAALMALAIAYPNLPDVSELSNYRPKLPLRVFTSEGMLIGEFGDAGFGHQVDERFQFSEIHGNLPCCVDDPVSTSCDTGGGLQLGDMPDRRLVTRWAQAGNHANRQFRKIGVMPEWLTPIHI